MKNPKTKEQKRRQLLVRRFWKTARGFWSPKARAGAWILSFGLVAIIVAQLFINYRINVWNRSVFDALEQKHGSEVAFQALLFVPLALASIVLAVTIVYVRMTMQRRWRRWMTGGMIDRWLANGRYYHLNLMKGEHENPEYRMAEDLRVATEAPVDFAAGILNAFLSAVTFIGVLWFVGGSLTIQLGNSTITIPGFLVLAAITYAILASTSMAYIGRRYVIASESKMQAEAEFRYALTRLRENGESIALIAGEQEELIGMSAALGNVIRRWRAICLQYMRTMTVAQSSFLLAPVIPVILSSPKYLQGTMSLGQVMQAASAFVTVQHAFNWLVDNYPRLADWTASACRVATLQVALDGLEKAEGGTGPGRILRGDAPEGVDLELRNVSVALDDGTIVLSEADVIIKSGEKVLFVGESGTGKSTLIRAIAGLWPWGDGEILINPNVKMMLLPQKPYLPLGPLRRSITYPVAMEEVPDEDVRQALIDAGLPELIDQMDKEAPWDQTLSGGEKQRIGFARLLIHRPDILIMDEGTSALDWESQEILMKLLGERLPDTTVISVGHRPELEAFHHRKLVLEYRREGAQIVHDESLLAEPEPEMAGWWARMRRSLKRGTRGESERTD